MIDQDFEGIILTIEITGDHRASGSAGRDVATVLGAIVMNDEPDFGMFKGVTEKYLRR